MEEQDYFELLNTILASAKIGAWAYDWKLHQYIYSNPVLDEIHERPVSDFLQNNQLWKESIHPEDRELESRGEQLMLAGQPVELEYRIITHKGQVKWICDRRKVVFDKSGQPARTEGVVEDITVRKQLEELLMQSEQTYRYLFENNPHPMWLFDTETFEFLAVNNAAVEHYGYSREEFLSMTTLDIRPKDEQVAMMKDVQLTQKNKNAASTRGIWQHFNKSGQTIFAEINSHSFTYQGKQVRLVVARDVTEQVETDRRIQLLNEDLNNFRYAVSAAFMLLALDLKGNVFYANRNLIARLQYEKSAIKGQNFRTFIPDFYPDYFFDDIIKKVQVGQIWRGELRLKTKNQSICWTDTFVIPVKNENGAINHFLVIQNDLTQSKEQEIEIMRLVEKLMVSEIDVREALQKALRLNEQLETAQRRLTNAQKLASLGNWDWEVATEKLFASEEIFAIFGITDEEFMQSPTFQHFITYVHPEDRKNFIKSHQFRVDGLDIEYRIIRPDGQLRYLHELSTVTRDENDKIVSFSGTVQDITQRKHVEIQLREQKQLLEEIADVSSHSFRRPVASILGLVNLFDFENHANPFNAEVIKLLQKATQELDTLLYDIVMKAQNDPGR
jgi:PAS domain S-box-containing protein